MIEIKNLYKNFGDKVVFDGANVQVDTGSICGLVGINGAGKSTMLRIVTGVIAADKGTVEIDGEGVYENEKVKRRLFFLPDDPYYDLNVTGEKLKEIYKVFYPFDNEVFDYYLKYFSLDEKKPIRNFSKGMKRQIMIACALACSPDYLFLDEAFDGLDPMARLEFKRGLIKLQGKGATVIIASHALRELEDICDSFILIDNTTVRVSGKIDSALENIFKLQLAFKEKVTPDDLPFDILRYEVSGKILTAVIKGDKENVLKQIEAMNPIIMEELPMDFEDMFIEEIYKR